MSKIIIHYDSEINIDIAFAYVQRVIDGGRISEKGKDKTTQYCFCTAFSGAGEYAPAIVFADITKTGTDVFHVRIDK